MSYGIMDKLTKAVRVLTVAPLMALLMLTILYFRDPAIFGGILYYILSVVFLTVFPLLAYPLQPLFRAFRGKGREGQRTLAIYFAVAGYIGGCLAAALFGAPKGVWVIFLCYLASGALVLLVNKLLHFKASGHACGVTGPFILLLYFGRTAGFLGIPLLALVWASSIAMKRHTALQLLGGSAIPLLALTIAVLIKLYL
jgi:hypothetical protein